jgi:hypothetical protein
MDATTGDGEPAAGIRASEAERDATLERLSAATPFGAVGADAAGPADGTRKWSFCSLGGI